MTADLGEVGLAGAHFVDQLAVKDDQDAVGKLEQLVEVLADQQDGGATVANRHDLGVDLRDGGEVEAEAGIGRDHDGDLTAELPRQHRALDIAARELADRRIAGSCLDLVAFDLAHRLRAHAGVIAPPARNRKGRTIEVAEIEIVTDAHAGDAGIFQRLFRQA